MPLKNYLSRFLILLLSLMNVLPPLYPELMHEKIGGINEVNVEERI